MDADLLRMHEERSTYVDMMRVLGRSHKAIGMRIFKLRRAKSLIDNAATVVANNSPQADNSRIQLGAE